MRKLYTCVGQGRFSFPFQLARGCSFYIRGRTQQHLLQEVLSIQCFSLEDRATVSDSTCHEISTYPPVYDCFTLLARATRSEQEGYKPLSLRSIRSPAFYSSQIECLRSPRTVHFCAVSYDVVCSQRRSLFVTIHLLRTTVSHTSSSHLIALPLFLCEPSMRASSSSSSLSLPTPSSLRPHTHTHTHTRTGTGPKLQRAQSFSK